MDLSRMARAMDGFSLKEGVQLFVDHPPPGSGCRYCPSFLVCPSNWASVSLTLMTQVNPSRTSSPESFSRPLRMLYFCHNR